MPFVRLCFFQSFDLPLQKAESCAVQECEKVRKQPPKYCIFLPYFYFFVSLIPSVICYRVTPKKYGGKVNNFKPISHTENSVFLR